MRRDQALLDAAEALRDALRRLRFGPPITHVYDPLEYAWPSYEQYVRRYGRTKKRVVFLGMNPGPYGMVQTGVPFGEVSAVREFLGIEAPVGRPARQHPKRPVDGFDCKRSEVSGARLWGAFRARFGTADRFFAHAFVANYCPLVFMEKSGKNFTPDKLRAKERERLYAACDAHLHRVVDALAPEWVIGVGAFAEQRARTVLEGTRIDVGCILHPSPASPAANRGWAEVAFTQLEQLGVLELMTSSLLKP